MPPEASDASVVARQVVNLIVNLTLMIEPVILGLLFWIIYTKIPFLQPTSQVILVSTMIILVITTGCICLVTMKSLMFLIDS
ncbi:hypothetical protein LZ30DRAFT_712372 [Colletotrichum cereale]|nr:hypothetical protein LZ30DRAFT_712372 [Colletotrichum cereale]